MTVLAAHSTAPSSEALQGLYEALRSSITADPTPVSDVLGTVLEAFPVDREEIVAALWDLVEDEGLVYDAAGKIRRRA